jgi:hypothetical protein
MSDVLVELETTSKVTHLKEHQSDVSKDVSGNFLGVASNNLSNDILN